MAINSCTWRCVLWVLVLSSMLMAIEMIWKGLRSMELTDCEKRRMARNKLGEMKEVFNERKAIEERIQWHLNSMRPAGYPTHIDNGVGGGRMPTLDFLKGLTALEAQYEEIHTRCVNTEAELLRMVYRMPYSRFRTILLQHYISGKPLSYVAYELDNRSFQTVKRLHRKALLQFYISNEGYFLNKVPK